MTGLSSKRSQGKHEINKLLNHKTISKISKYDPSTHFSKAAMCHESLLC